MPSSNEKGNGASAKNDDRGEESTSFHECLDVISMSTSSPDKSNASSEDADENDSNHDDSEHVQDPKKAEETRYSDLGAKTSSLRQLSRDLSKELVRRRSSLKEVTPETPLGWTILMTAVSSAVVGYEAWLQHALTCPPLVYGQCQKGPLKSIVDQLTKDENSILSRRIQPSLFIGTRGVLASGAAYAFGGPASTDHSPIFREVLTTSDDGATIAIDWELPRAFYSSSVSLRKSMKERENQIRKGPIALPVVIILHGINNDASFGYMRSLMRTCTERGWIAVGMNFRGCGGIPLSTPRCYTAAYTGDLRHVVRKISGRLATNVPIFLVGNSLGASLVVKYLGEEGLSGTLPACVAGGISLGNPLKLEEMRAPWKHLLSLGARKGMLENWTYLRKMTNSHFQGRLRMALHANTIGAFDEAMAPTFIRNERQYPFVAKIGYESASKYWHDGSSYRVVSHVSVPLLNILSRDDFMVYGPSFRKLSFCLENPNVVTVTTKCGGHLGWQESPPDTGNIFGFGTSWADTATADFIEAVLAGHPYTNPENKAIHQTQNVRDPVKLRSRM